MFENARPSRTPDHLVWKHITLPPKGEMKGWVCGPVVGSEGHQAGAHKPCRDKLTKGKMVCPYCIMPLPLRFSGFLPFIDMHGSKLVISINLDNTARVDGMKHLDPIFLKKGPIKTSPVEVFSKQWTDMKPTGRNITNRPADIREWMLTVLWKSEGLAEWFRGEGAEMIPMVEMEPPHSTGMVPHPDRAIHAADKRGKLPRLSDHWRKRQAEDAADVIPTTNDTPSANGKHKPKG